MHPLALRRVPVDWCTACRALWFDRGELALALGLTGTPAMTREQPAARCPACRGLLWFSDVQGSDVLACVDCGGCFVSEAVLRRRGAVPAAGVDGSFTCATCGDDYPLSAGGPTPKGLECHRCTPPPKAPPPARSPLEELLEGLVAFARRLFP